MYLEIELVTGARHYIQEEFLVCHKTGNDPFVINPASRAIKGYPGVLHYIIGNKDIIAISTQDLTKGEVDNTTGRLFPKTHITSYQWVKKIPKTGLEK